MAIPPPPRRPPTTRRPVRPENPLPAAPLPLDFHLGAEEHFLFDLWAQEHTRIAGTKIEFYSLNTDKSQRDALYDEPVVRHFDGPFSLVGYVEYPNDETEAREEGFRTTWTGTIWIARKEFEDANAPIASEGDVIRIWDKPFFNDNWATSGDEVPGGGYYFDLTNVSDAGHLFDNPWFVGVTSRIRRRQEFTPERRLTNK